MNLRDQLTTPLVNHRYDLLSALLGNCYGSIAAGNLLREQITRATRELNALAVAINFLDATG